MGIQKYDLPTYQLTNQLTWVGARDTCVSKKMSIENYPSTDPQLLDTKYHIIIREYNHLSTNTQRILHICDNLVDHMSIPLIVINNFYDIPITIVTLSIPSSSVGAVDVVLVGVVRWFFAIVEPSSQEADKSNHKDEDH